MAREIPLTRERFAIVDDADYETLAQHLWHYMTVGYAGRDEDGRRVLMHRAILNAPDGLQVDHINHDGLDNRRANLRLVTRAQNEQNRRGPQRGSSTGIRNVYPCAGSSTYFVALHLAGQKIYLGTYPTLEEADAAARAARRDYMPYSVE